MALPFVPSQISLPHPLSGPAGIANSGILHKHADARPDLDLIVPSADVATLSANPAGAHLAPPSSAFGSSSQPRPGFSSASASASALVSASASASAARRPATANRSARFSGRPPGSLASIRLLPRIPRPSLLPSSRSPCYSCPRCLLPSARTRPTPASYPTRPHPPSPSALASSQLPRTASSPTAYPLSHHADHPGPVSPYLPQPLPHAVPPPAHRVRQYLSTARAPCLPNLREHFLFTPTVRLRPSYPKPGT